MRVTALQFKIIRKSSDKINKVMAQVRGCLGEKLVGVGKRMLMLERRTSENCLGLNERTTKENVHHPQYIQ